MMRVAQDLGQKGERLELLLQRISALRSFASESAVNQAWGVSQSRHYEADPAKAAELYKSLALSVMQLAASGETGIQNLVQRAVMFPPVKP